MTIIIPDKNKFVNKDQIKEILTILASIDKDMSPLLNILISSVYMIEDISVMNYQFINILKFYGIGNDDILTSRQKYTYESGMNVKKPFLKKHQKENLLNLINKLGIEL